jgi:hypothetical protein
MAIASLAFDAPDVHAARRVVEARGLYVSKVEPARRPLLLTMPTHASSV